MGRPPTVRAAPGSSDRPLTGSAPPRRVLDEPPPRTPSPQRVEATAPILAKLLAAPQRRSSTGCRSSMPTSTGCTSSTPAAGTAASPPPDTPSRRRSVTRPWSRSTTSRSPHSHARRPTERHRRPPRRGRRPRRATGPRRTRRGGRGCRQRPTPARDPTGERPRITRARSHPAVGDPDAAAPARVRGRLGSPAGAHGLLLARVGQSASRRRDKTTSCAPARRRRCEAGRTARHEDRSSDGRPRTSTHRARSSPRCSRSSATTASTTRAHDHRRRSRRRTPAPHPAPPAPLQASALPRPAGPVVPAG